MEQPKSPLNVTVVHQDNMGFGLARARSNGARAAAHDILVFLDGDMIAEAGGSPSTPSRATARPDGRVRVVRATTRVASTLGRSGRCVRLVSKGSPLPATPILRKAKAEGDPHPGQAECPMWQGPRSGLSS